MVLLESNSRNVDSYGTVVNVSSSLVYDVYGIYGIVLLAVLKR